MKIENFENVENRKENTLFPSTSASNSPDRVDYLNYANTNTRQQHLYMLKRNQRLTQLDFLIH